MKVLFFLLIDALLILAITACLLKTVRLLSVPAASLCAFVSKQCSGLIAQYHSVVYAISRSWRVRRVSLASDVHSAILTPPQELVDWSHYDMPTYLRQLADPESQSTRRREQTVWKQFSKQFEAELSASH